MNSYVPSAMSSLRTDGFDHQIDRLFDEALRAFGTSNNNWAPACNVWENENGFYLQMALPGWESKDITLEVTNQVLTVKGERAIESSSEPQKYHLREIIEGQFTRLFRLPAFVDQGKASATHKHGLLTISFPKREEAKPRQIMIEGS